MKNLIIVFRMVAAASGVLSRRMLGKKKFSTWDVKTEIIWATTRITLTSAPDLGFDWLKSFSQSYVPKPKLADKVNIEEAENSVGSYLVITPKNEPSTLQTSMIYFHGGGYIIGSPHASLEFLTRLCLEADTRIIVPFYPLAPENVYPVAHEFAEKFVSNIIKDGEPQSTIVSGDSAGAALALSALLKLDNKTRVKVRGCLLISPWVEPLVSGGSIITNSQNDVGNRKFVVGCYETYIGDSLPQAEHPLDFSTIEFLIFCPTLVTVGGAEILLDQAVSLAERMKTSGIKVESHIYENMFHTFWNLGSMVPESLKIVNDISNWLRRL